MQALQAYDWVITQQTQTISTQYPISTTNQSQFEQLIATPPPHKKKEHFLPLTLPLEGLTIRIIPGHRKGSLIITT